MSSSSLTNAKTFGGIGSIFVLLTPMPYAGWVLGIAGFVMILLAVKYISDYARDASIFNNIAASIIFAIGGIAVGTLMVLGSVFRFVGLNNLTAPDFNPSTVPTGDWIGLATSILFGLVALWALLIVSAIFLRRSYGAIASNLHISMFETAGLVYLIGAALTIIGIGFIVIFVAQILLVVAFFSIPEEGLLQRPTAQNIPLVSA